MKKQAWKAYVGWIVFTEAVGALSGWLTRDGVRIYQETVVPAALTPPAIVFPIVWTILYALMGIGAARVYLSPRSEERTLGLGVYLLQLLFNFAWSIIFFGAQSFGFALLWLIVLWLLIVWMILTFRKVDPLAAYLQLPYLVWVTFAAYLNFAVWRLNT